MERDELAQLGFGHEAFSLSLELDLHVGTALFNMYAKCGSIDNT